MVLEGDFVFVVDAFDPRPAIKVMMAIHRLTIEDEACALDERLCDPLVTQLDEAPAGALAMTEKWQVTRTLGRWRRWLCVDMDDVVRGSGRPTCPQCGCNSNEGAYSGGTHIDSQRHTSLPLHSASVVHGVASVHTFATQRLPNMMSSQSTSSAHSAAVLFRPAAAALFAYKPSPTIR